MFFHETSKVRHVKVVKPQFCLRYCCKLNFSLCYLLLTFKLRLTLRLFGSFCQVVVLKAYKSTSQSFREITAVNEVHYIHTCFICLYLNMSRAYKKECLTYNKSHVYYNVSAGKTQEEDLENNNCTVNFNVERKTIAIALVWAVWQRAEDKAMRWAQKWAVPGSLWRAYRGASGHELDPLV